MDLQHKIYKFLGYAGQYNQPFVNYYLKNYKYARTLQFLTKEQSKILQRNRFQGLKNLRNVSMSLTQKSKGIRQEFYGKIFKHSGGIHTVSFLTGVSFKVKIIFWKNILQQNKNIKFINGLNASIFKERSMQSRFQNSLQKVNFQIDQGYKVSDLPNFPKISNIKELQLTFNKFNVVKNPKFVAFLTTFKNLEYFSIKILRKQTSIVNFDKIVENLINAALKNSKSSFKKLSINTLDSQNIWDISLKALEGLENQIQLLRTSIYDVEMLNIEAMSQFTALTSLNLSLKGKVNLEKPLELLIMLPKITELSLFFQNQAETTYDFEKFEKLSQQFKKFHLNFSDLNQYFTMNINSLLSFLFNQKELEELTLILYLSQEELEKLGENFIKYPEKLKQFKFSLSEYPFWALGQELESTNISFVPKILSKMRNLEDLHLELRVYQHQTKVDYSFLNGLFSNIKGLKSLYLGLPDYLGHNNQQLMNITRDIKKMKFLSSLILYMAFDEPFDCNSYLHELISNCRNLNSIELFYYDEENCDAISEGEVDFTNPEIENRYGMHRVSANINKYAIRYSYYRCVLVQKDEEAFVESQ